MYDSFTHETTAVIEVGGAIVQEIDCILTVEYDRDRDFYEGPYAADAWIDEIKVVGWDRLTRANKQVRLEKDNPLFELIKDSISYDSLVDAANQHIDEE
jgi:hypothetical protein